MKLKGRFFLFIAQFALLLCLLPAAVYIYKDPDYDFNMPGYMALILRMDQNSSIEEIIVRLIRSKTLICRNENR
jgi:hypothetical protein